MKPEDFDQLLEDMFADDNAEVFEDQMAEAMAENKFAAVVALDLALFNFAYTTQDLRDEFIERHIETLVKRMAGASPGSAKFEDVYRNRAKQMVAYVKDCREQFLRKPPTP